MGTRVVLLLVILNIACAPAKKQSDEADKALDSFFRQAIPATDPGAAVLVMSGDTLLFSGGYGLADLKDSIPVTTGTLFNLGSISKTFVSNAILQLRDSGKLSLQDPVGKYFPGFTSKSIAANVTIAHLLTHTSGLPDIRFPYEDSVFYLTAKDEENWAPILKAEKLNFESGTRFEYSNPAFNGLALIIQQVSGTKWQDFIREGILVPSGMTTSTITDGPHPASGVAHGYIFSRGEWLEKDYMEEPTFAASGNGGVWSSVDELALYRNALRSATFLNEATIRESMEVKEFPGWNDTIPAHIGWSWFIGKTENGMKTIGHTGSQGGFRANFVMVPEKNWFIVILSTTPRDLDGWTNRLMEFLSDRR
ncbi:MAG: serine hydrolase domain-containing protein [Bacteroidota bacterium]